MIIHFPKTNNWRDRIAKTMDIITSLQLPPQSKILDIGGKDYFNYCKKNNFQYTMIDLETPLTTGLGGYNGDENGLLYDGRNLPFEEESFDLIIVGFVFHHASNNTLFLLKQIKNIAKKYIIVGEDLAELSYHLEWHHKSQDLK